MTRPDATALVRFRPGDISVMARHPGGAASAALANAEARKILERRARCDAAALRSRVASHPAFLFPLAAAVGHLLAFLQ